MSSDDDENKTVEDSKENNDHLLKTLPLAGGTLGGHHSVSGGNELNGAVAMGGFAEGGILGGGKRRKAKAKSKGRKKSRSRSKKGGAAKRKPRK